MGKVYVPILTIVDRHTAFCPSYSLAAFAGYIKNTLSSYNKFNIFTTEYTEISR